MVVKQAMKQKVRILLTPEALMMATALQKGNLRPLSHVIEDCIRWTYEHKNDTDVETLGCQ